MQPRFHFAYLIDIFECLGYFWNFICYCALNTYNNIYIYLPTQIFENNIFNYALLL